MDLQKELARFGRYGVVDKLLEATRRPVLYSPEPFTHIIPSIVIGADGPTLARLLLVSPNYLCDVELTGNQRNVFDYVAKKTIRDYRFNIWDHEVRADNDAVSIYQIADIHLVHGGITQQFVTQLQYAGDQRDQWLQSVIEAIPIPLINPAWMTGEL